MRFSLFYNFDVLPGTSVAELYGEIEAQAIAADALGFDTIWLAEHHFELYGRMPAPLLFLARLSAMTRRIGLGTAVVEAPLYNPLRLAEDSALVDLLSGGRLRLGIGSGARNKPAEFERFHVPLEQKTERMLEVVEILRQAFDTGRVDFVGASHQFAGIELNPRPRQRAADLLWLAAGEATPDLAGLAGYGLLVPRVGASERHLQSIERYRAALAGRSGRVALLRYVYAAATEQEAKEQTRIMFARYAKYDCGVDWDGRTEGVEYAGLIRSLNMVIGTPAQVIEQMRAWQRHFGCDEIMCQVYAAGIRHTDALRSIELLGREVFPAFGSAVAQAAL